MNSTKMRTAACENLLVSAVNTALERGLFKLEAGPVTEGPFEFTLGGYPVIAHVRDAEFLEVSLNVICCPTDEGRKNVAVLVTHTRFREGGEACAHGWLTRPGAKFFENTTSYRGTKEMTEALARLSADRRV